MPVGQDSASGTGAGEASDRSQLAEVGKVMLAYEEFGDPADETVLLVMGLGMQMLGWDEQFCEQIAARDYHVVRFDNRDTGLSSKVGGRRVNVTAGMLGFTGSAAYTLDDMATDTLGLLDYLGIESAHLVGASMGGMISQKLAATHPERVASLCSIMAGTGKRRFSTLPRLDALRILMRSPATTREDFIEGMTSAFDTIGSPAYPADPVRLRERAARSYDRCFYPTGAARQMMAILASGDRTEELRRITAPTLVIHGAADRLVPVRAGRDVAAAIPGARLEIIEGMGHDLPQQLWPRLIESINDNAGA
jgi:pimeloyl-ACP methyl ester carboxylesterase